MTAVRQAAVAGIFYPGDPIELAAAVRGYLDGVKRTDAPVPKAIIAPHAGYIYSGAVAASAYARLASARARIRRVVLLGPCHRVAVRGLAASSAGFFETPLGRIPVDAEALATIQDLPQVSVFDPTHGQEHSLEVHLPFLQVILDAFSIVPLVVGNAGDAEIADVLDRLWGGDETLIVVSSDLSHYHDYETARKMDVATCRAIEQLRPDRIGREQACGRIPVAGLLTLAKRRGMKVATLDLRNSGDTAGPRDRVVGYGSWAVFEAEAFPKRAPTEGRPAVAMRGPQTPRTDRFAERTRELLDHHGRTLIRLAAASIEHGLAHGTPVPLSGRRFDAELLRPGASFVSLHRNGELRGCIGSFVAHRPLVEDVAANGFSAAFKDPRFSPLDADERDELELSLSLLSAPIPIEFSDEADLLSKLRPDVDGVIVEDSGRRALFLPVVWKALPQPRDFLTRLKIKAGMAGDHWSEAFKAWRFVAEEISASSLGDPGAIWTGSDAS
ncbi:MAG: AmmeMemoRadiSam system protein B [Alphaproteobacteria bacterium]|nr:AmmeMemoRadiSam system protein B [Alphaproteobacteria bacterium]